MREEELKEILRLHKLWCDTDEKEGKRAFLMGAYLGDADLEGAFLAVPLVGRPSVWTRE